MLFPLLMMTVKLLTETDFEKDYIKMLTYPKKQQSLIKQ